MKIDEFDGELQIGEEGEKLDEEDDIVIELDTETETPNMEDTEPEQQTKESKWRLFFSPIGIYVTHPCGA